MQLNLGLQLEEDMKKQLATEPGRPAKCPDFCTASFSGCLCRNICHCSATEVTKESFEFLFAESSHTDASDQFSELTEAEEHLHKITRLEAASNDVASENQVLKGFLEYMESNYKNQYETQRLVIEDLKLQIEELLSQLKAAQNNLDIKSAENDELLRNLGRRKAEFEDLYFKMKALEAELDHQKSLKSDDGQSMEYLKAKVAKLTKSVAALKEQLADKDRQAREAAEASKSQAAEKQDENLELRLVVSRQENTLNTLSDAISDLKEQLATRESELEALKSRPASRGEVPLSVHKSLQDELDALRTELKKKNSENQKLRNENGDLGDSLKKALADAEQERLNHDETRDALQAKEGVVAKHLAAIRDLEAAAADQEDRIRDLMEEVGQAVKARKDLEGELDRERADNQALKDEIYRLKNDTSGRKVQNPLLGQLQFENEDLRKQLEALRTLADRLQNDNDELSRELSSRDVEVSNLKKQLSALTDKLKEVTLARDQLKAQADKANLTSNIKAQGLQGQLLDKDKQIASLNDQIAALKAELREANSKLAETNEDARNAKGDVAILRKQLADSEKAVDVLNKEKLQLNKNLKTLKDSHDQKTHDLQVLTKQLEDRTVELAATKEALAAASSERDTLRTTSKKLSDDLTEATNNLEKFRLSYNKMQQDFEAVKLKLTQERDNMSKKIEELTLELERVKGDHSLRDQLEQLRKQFANLQAELDRKNSELSSAQMQIESLNQKVKDLQAALDRSETKLRAATAENETLKKEVEDLYLGLTRVLSETWQVKLATYSTYDELTDNEVDLKSQERVIAEAKREQFLPLTLDLLIDIKKIEKENYVEVGEIKTSIRNITREKSYLLEQKQQLETKANDLQKRHDDKTRMVGQLAVKLFVLVSEVERLQGIPSK